jgi:hypothetical protein
MPWQKFGYAVSLHGVVNRRDSASGLLCVAINGTREQWCRFGDSVTDDIPEVGANVEIFGWEKWNTRVIEILDLRRL